MRAMMDQFCASCRRPPASIILDIDDTFDAVPTSSWRCSMRITTSAASCGSTADALYVRRAEEGAAARRTWAKLRYGAKSWNKQRQVIARLVHRTTVVDKTG